MLKYSFCPPPLPGRSAYTAMGVSGHVHDNFQKNVLNVAFSCILGSNLTARAEYFVMC